MFRYTYGVTRNRFYCYNVICIKKSIYKIISVIKVKISIYASNLCHKLFNFVSMIIYIIIQLSCNLL